MTKKDYEKAAAIARDKAAQAQNYNTPSAKKIGLIVHQAVVESFINLFMDDNPRFDQVRFRQACQGSFK